MYCSKTGNWVYLSLLYCKLHEERYIHFDLWVEEIYYILYDHMMSRL